MQVTFAYFTHINMTVAKAYIERDAALIVDYVKINKLILITNKTKLVKFRPLSAYSLFVLILCAHVSLTDM